MANAEGYLKEALEELDRSVLKLKHSQVPSEEKEALLLLRELVKEQVSNENLSHTTGKTR